MKREIKFRAWFSGIPAMVEFGLGENNIDVYDSIDDKFTVDINNADSIMQYTGLKDRHGKEVFEGDVVKVLRGSPEALANTYQIKYFNAAFQMWGKGNDIPTAFVTYAKHAVDRGIEFEEIGELIEVIGNVHSNPELL